MPMCERTGSAALARDARVLAATTFTGQFPLVARRARTVEHGNSRGDRRGPTRSRSARACSIRNSATAP